MTVLDGKKRKKQVVKNRYYIEWKSFWIAYLFWLGGFVLNFLSIFLSCFSEYLSRPLGSYRLWENFLVDTEFMFICFSTAFLLIVEICIQRKATSKIILYTLGAFVLCSIAVYLISIFSAGWSTHISHIIREGINIAGVMLLFIVGTFYLIMSNTTKQREVSAK